jgi:hypothetical protein
VVPDATWDENWRNIQAIAEIARRMSLRLVTFHAGFLPHDERDPDFVKLLARIRTIADLFAARASTWRSKPDRKRRKRCGRFCKSWPAQRGREFRSREHDSLRQGRSHHGAGNPRALAQTVHLKDATRTKTPGSWGEEVTVGTG